MASDIAAGWFAGFIKDYPGVRFRILDGNSDDLIEKLRSGIISLAVITAPCNQALLNSFSVGTDKMSALMSKDHPLARRENNDIDIPDILNEPLIVPSRKAMIDMIYKWFRAYKAEPHIICEMDSYHDAAALAEKGVGGICRTGQEYRISVCMEKRSPSPVNRRNLHRSCKEYSSLKSDHIIIFEYEKRIPR